MAKENSTQEIQSAFNQLTTVMQNKVDLKTMRPLIEGLDQSIQNEGKINRALSIEQTTNLVRQLQILSKTPHLDVTQKQALTNLMKPILSVYESILKKQYKQHDALSNIVTELREEVRRLSPNK
jgi:hypothetical protein